MQKRIRQMTAIALSAAIAVTSLPLTAMAEAAGERKAASAKEILENGYEIDMGDLPKVHFSEHPQWEEIYDAAWNIHKNNIQKIPAATNPEEPYYVDEAFRENIFVWDTMFMMMFDKWGMNQFPTLPSIDNFYYNQIDSEDDNDGFICREIEEATGKNCWDPNTQKNTGTNPPMFAWAEWEQYQIHGDVSRFSKEINGKTIFERLVSHYNYIERTKKLENGLYGKTNGYGNGLDNTPNQDGQRLNLDDSAGKQTYNDLCNQQAQAAWYIALIAEAMGNTEQAEYFRAENKRIADLINEKLWSPNAHMYSNLSENGKSKTNVSTPTNLWALAGHVATEERAKEIIDWHGRNSMKLYRPNGLASLCYDWDGGTGPFHPQGQYWTGSIWAPTSYQYIWGLKEYGYDQLAFEEALRHVNLASDVYEDGKNGVYKQGATFWENYSSDYVRHGSEAKANFVGWSGCFAVGMVIEDLIGIDIDAPKNIVTWNVRLTEEFGVDNLWMKHNGVENRVSLHADKRASELSDLNFTATVTQPVKLVVKTGGKEETFNLTEGTHKYTVKGTVNDAQPGYIGTKVRPLAEAADEVTKAYYDANATDYVYFTDQKNADIHDGIDYQTGKNGGKFFNVNTVGRPMNQNGETFAQLTDSDSLEKLGFAGAKAVTKGNCMVWDETEGEVIYSDEGFMIMVPSSNSLQTLRILVGVQNGTAKLKAQLSDASDGRVEIPVKGGSKECEYVIDIPFRSGLKESDILVQWLIDNAKTDRKVKVSIKNMALLNGGVITPDIPKSAAVSAAGDGKISVSAEMPEENAYDGWNVTVYNAVDHTEIKTVSAQTMPCEVTDLCAYGKYYAAVSGVRDGISSDDRFSDPILIEPQEASDAARAKADLDWTLKGIYNGNTADSTKNRFEIGAKGELYGSVFTISSSSDRAGYGVQNDGSVRRPSKNWGDAKSKITIKAEYNGETAEKTETAKVKAAMPEMGYAIESGSEQYNNSEVNLTAEGTKDWYQFRNRIRRHEYDYSGQPHKKDGSGISRIAFNSDMDPGNPDGAGGERTEWYNDLPITFIYEGEDAAGSDVKQNRGAMMWGSGNYWTLCPGYSENNQQINLYTGIQKGTASVLFLINDEIVSRQTITSEDKDLYRISFDYQLAEPGDRAEIRIVLEQGEASSLHAITLRERPLEKSMTAEALKAGEEIFETNNQKEDGTAVYTGESWTAFEAAYRAVTEKTEAGIEDFDTEQLKGIAEELDHAMTLLKTLERKAAEDMANNALAEKKTENENYTADSWREYCELVSALEQMLSDSKELPEELAALAEQVKNYSFVEEPTEEEKALAAAKKAAEEALAAKKTENEGYTQESWEAYQALVRSLEEKLSDKTATAEELTNLANQVKNYSFAWEPTEEEKTLAAAKKAAEEALAGRKTQNEGYTKESWEAYQTLVSYLEEKLADEAATAEELTNLANQVKNYSFAWEPTEEEKTLAAAKKAAEEALAGRKTQNEGYTKKSWEAYQTLVSYLEEKLADEAATAEELTNLANQVKNYSFAVEPEETEKILAEAKEALRQAVEKAESAITAGKKNYTDESWSAFMRAYEAAKAAPENADAGTLSRLAADLLEKQGALKEKEEDKNKGSKKELKKGDTKDIKKIRYKVTDAKKKTVLAVKGLDKKAGSIQIPDTVEINGKKCSVTEIGSSAFKGYGKAVSLTVGKNVKTIGKQAFKSCKKLKTVKITGKALKMVKSGAFKNTAKSVKVKWPKSLSKKQRSRLTKMLKKQGLKTK